MPIDPTVGFQLQMILRLYSALSVPLGHFHVPIPG